MRLTTSHLALAALILTAGCGGGNKGGGPTQPTSSPPPTITCPSDVTIREVRTALQPVTYSTPTTSGGSTPVTVTCNPASGSDFKLGTTPVSCSVTDSQARSASCSFNVTLTGFTLGATRFDAFGDSITEGEVGRPNISFPFLDPPNAYPTRLQAAFDDFYPDQGIVVVNRGLSGDSVEGTEEKIRRFLPIDKPDAVLLLTGYNNLTLACGAGRSGSDECRDAIDKVAFGLRDCLRRVPEANAGVRFTFLSNLTPPGATGSNRIDRDAIVRLNDRIRQLSSAQGAVYVDAYAAFVGHEAEYVNVDGLHLRPAGYQALADTFFAAIRNTIPQTPITTLHP